MRSKEVLYFELPLGTTVSSVSAEEGW